MVQDQNVSEPEEQPGQFEHAGQSILRKRQQQGGSEARRQLLAAGSGAVVRPHHLGVLRAGCPALLADLARALS
ncbi:hypothetical protein [Streptomyces prunicolor]|uniref:hypothetical protein n=1 Tax=Streptomyces prunicolor TaxID=67348 RepID=UPI0033FA02DC